MYNPFKPHICQYHNGSYGIRRSKLFLWEYLDALESINEDNPDPYWWTTPKAAVRWATFSSLTKAQQALATYHRTQHNTKNFSQKV